MTAPTSTVTQSAFDPASRLVPLSDNDNSILIRLLEKTQQELTQVRQAYTRAYAENYVLLQTITILERAVITRDNALIFAEQDVRAHIQEKEELRRIVIEQRNALEGNVQGSHSLNRQPDAQNAMQTEPPVDETQMRDELEEGLAAVWEGARRHENPPGT